METLFAKEQQVGAPQEYRSSKWDDVEEVGLVLLESRLKLIGFMRDEAAAHCARFTRALEEELMSAKSPSRGSQSDHRSKREGVRARCKLRSRPSLACIPTGSDQESTGTPEFHRWHTTK